MREVISLLSILLIVIALSSLIASGSLVLYVYEDFDDGTVDDSGWYVEGDYAFENGMLRLLNPQTSYPYDFTSAIIYYRADGSSISFNNFTWSMRTGEWFEGYKTFSIRYYDNYTDYMEGADITIQMRDQITVKCFIYDRDTTTEIPLENITFFGIYPDGVFSINIYQFNRLVLKSEAPDGSVVFKEIDISVCQLDQQRSIFELEIYVDNDPGTGEYEYIENGMVIDDLMIVSDTEYSQPSGETTTVTETQTETVTQTQTETQTITQTIATTTTIVNQETVTKVINQTVTPSLIDIWNSLSIVQRAVIVGAGFILFLLIAASLSGSGRRPK